MDIDTDMDRANFDPVQVSLLNASGEAESDVLGAEFEYFGILSLLLLFSVCLVLCVYRGLVKHRDAV